MLWIRPESIILIVFLLIIVVITLIELNQENRLENFGRRMIQLHEGIEIENDFQYSG
jgi:hypothetical protein